VIENCKNILTTCLVISNEQLHMFFLNNSDINISTRMEIHYTISENWSKYFIKTNHKYLLLNYTQRKKQFLTSIYQLNNTLTFNTKEIYWVFGTFLLWQHKIWKGILQLDMSILKTLCFIQHNIKFHYILHSPDLIYKSEDWKQSKIC
jgi:hypothetical protein